MNPIVKALWIADLRSCKIPQGKGRLRRLSENKIPIGDCCLGRLCEISNLGEWITEPSRTDVLRYQIKQVIGIGKVSLYGSSYNYLPVGIREWAGIDANGTIPGSDKLEVREELSRIVGIDHRQFPQYMNHGVELAQLNDMGVPFAKIADVIEKFF